MTPTALGDKPPLDLGRGDSRNSATAKRGTLLVFLLFQVSHQRSAPSAQPISPRRKGVFSAQECWPGKANSRLLQAGISPWSLAPRYLFSLNRCHQRCWALWLAASRAGPSNDTSRCTSDIHAVSHGVLSRGCRYSKVGRRSLADLVLHPAAATDFVQGGKNQTPSLWLFCLLQI